MIHLLLVLSIKSVYYSKQIDKTSVSKNKNGILNENDLDSNQYTQNTHSITIINNITEKKYYFLSILSKDSTDSIINQTTIIANYPFKVFLYVFSYKCQQRVHILTVNSTINEIIINDSYIPEKCRYDYNLTIKNKFSLSSYHLYYRFFDNNFYEIKDSITLNSISLDLYMKSNNCSDYTFISTAKAKINQSTEILIHDSDAPHQCLIPYYVTIYNKFNIPDYKLYYYDNEYQNYVPIENNYTKKSNNFFGISLYMSSDSCYHEFMFTVNATLYETIEKVISNSNAVEKCQLYTNFLKIMPNITYPETYIFDPGEYDLYSRITSKNISSGGTIYQSIYINSTYCPKHIYLTTLTSSEDYNLITYIQNSDVPRECKSRFPYQLTILNNFTNEDYTLYARESITVFTEIKDSLKMQESEPFSVEIYMKSNYTKNECYLRTVQSTDNLTEKIIFNDIDVPEHCISPPKYFMTIKISPKINSNVYRMNEYGSYYTLGWGVYENESYAPFQYDLYIKNFFCYGYNYFLTVKATTNKSDVIVIDNDKIPYNCQQCYYFITIKNNLKLNDYHLYYLEITNNSYIEIKSSKYFKTPKPFSIKLYINTTFCPSLDYIGSFNLGDKSYTLTINKSYIKEQCRSQYIYFATIEKQILFSVYGLYYLNETTNEYIEIQDSYCFQSHDYFQIKLYIYYEECQTYVFVCDVPLSEDPTFTKIITDEHVHLPCKIQSIGFSILNISQDYTIGYKISYDSSDVIYPAKDKIVIRSTEVFGLSFYLINSKKCNNKKFLEVKSNENYYYDLYHITDHIPKKCIMNTVNVGLVVGLSCAGFVVIVALCILTVFLVRKRKNKNKQTNDNSNQISEMLQQDNGYTT